MLLKEIDAVCLFQLELKNYKLIDAIFIYKKNFQLTADIS